MTRTLLLTLALLTGAAPANELDLPNLGDSSTSLFSAEQEYQLGRAWLRLFRNQVRTINDPLMQDYVEGLTFNLVTHSALQDRRVALVLVDNPVLNAFAVPGGVIGVHSGLLTYAQSEGELATVLAHEIAHLSQRHFSRGVEHQRKQQPLTLAGLLTGAVLVATTGGTAGLAALAATQAATVDARLRFSRANEQEADRIGMNTMIDAGLDPHAAPAMFERMLKESRHANQVPEYLRTHPLSESRVADTRSRALNLDLQRAGAGTDIRAGTHTNIGAGTNIRTDTTGPANTGTGTNTHQHTDTGTNNGGGPRRTSQQQPSLSFHLMRARARLRHTPNPQRAVAEFRASLGGNTLLQEADEYGLALALTQAGQPAAAREHIDRLLAKRPQRIEYIIASAELDISTGKAQAAVQTLEQQLTLAPGNHPLTMAHANALLQAGQAHIAEDVLVAQSRAKPDDPGLWYLLAEVQGKSGNILGLHQSRAEYFMLNGALGPAERQLNYALERAGQDFPTTEKIKKRLDDLARLRWHMQL